VSALTRGYLVDKTSDTWAQPMRRWTDTLTTVRRSVLVDLTPIHDALELEVYEARVAQARAHIALADELDALEGGAPGTLLFDREHVRTSHRRRRWGRR
jgi:hypothetical protein